MNEYRVMVVGAGAREHVLSNAYERSAGVGEIIVAPGNDFMTINREIPVSREPAVSLKDPWSILDAAVLHNVDFVDIAQDDAIASGAADLLEHHGFPVFAPSKEAARLESDKGWSREAMERFGVPTPKYKPFSMDEADAAKEYLEDEYAENPDKVVFVKAAGLAAGKGALKAKSSEEAIARIDQLASDFPEASRTFVVEDGLDGNEYSFYVISDGKTYKAFKPAKDNKLSHNGDTGTQTGGMGSVAPGGGLSPGLQLEVIERQVKPVIEGMATEGYPFTGILYVGGIEASGQINTIEFNVRWGDPEAQVVVPGITTDYFELTESAAGGELAGVRVMEDGLTRVCVVGTAKGYPGKYERGMEITGLGRAAEVPGVEIYGASVVVRDGRFYADGGRLFSVVGAGRDDAEARERAYEAIGYVAVEGDNLHKRDDI